MEKISKKLVLAILATGIFSFAGVLIETAMNVTFPRLMELFDAPLSQLQWLTTAYLLMLAVMMPLSAYLKRRFLLKQLFTTAALFFIGGLVVDVIAPTLPILIIGRVLQGVGTGISLPMMFNIILEQAPRKKIGLLMGIGNFITAIAPAIGPTYGGILVDSLGWRAVFYLIIPILVLAYILGMYTIEQKTAPSKPKFDGLGWIYISIVLIGMIMIFTEFQHLGSQIVMYIALVIVGSILALVHYKKQAQPILQLRLFKRLDFNLHLGQYFIGQFAVLSFSFLIPNMVQIVLHESSFVSGVTMFPGAFVGALLAPVGGILYDRFGAKKPIATGLILQMIGGGLFVFLLSQSTSFGLAEIYIFFTFGMSISMPNIMTNGLQQLSLKDQADGNALFNTLQQFAGAVGTSIVAAIVASDTSKNQFTGFHSAFFFIFVVLIIDVLLFIWLAKYEKRKTFFTD